MSFGTTNCVAVHGLPSDRRVRRSKIGNIGTANRVCTEVPDFQPLAAQRLSGEWRRGGIFKNRKNRGRTQVLEVMAVAWRSKRSRRWHHNSWGSRHEALDRIGGGDGFRNRCAGSDEPLVWPQFRGPGGSGVADDQQPPVEIGPDKNVAWKVPVPSGLSSPIVVGDMLVLTAFEDGKLYTIAYHRADGSEAWRAQAPATQIEPYPQDGRQPGRVDARRPTASGSSPTSARAASFATTWPARSCGNTSCRRRRRIADFGSGTSPILADGTVVLVRDELKDPKIIALDACDGRRQVGEEARVPTPGSARRSSGTRRTARRSPRPDIGQDDRLRSRIGRRKVVCRRYAVGVLHDAGHVRRRSVFRRLVARRSGRIEFQNAASSTPCSKRTTPTRMATGSSRKRKPRRPS